MKNIYYLYVIFIVSICAVTFPSCQDTLSLGNEKIIGGEGKGLSVNEAREFFEKDMSEKASRSGKDEKEQKYYTQYFMLPVGDFTPKWEEGISTDAPTLYSVDVPIETSYRYRAIRIDEKTNKPYTTTCYHEMVVVKDQDGKMGYRIVFYIPDREYDLTHGGDISRQLTNGLDMGDYSGLKIYTNTEGQFTRVNRFLNGEKIQAINLNTKQSPKEFAINLLRSLKIIGKIHIQRQKIKTTISRGEDDWYDDWSDWWDDYYDDDYEFEDPYDDSDDKSNNDWWGNNEDALNVNNDYFWQVAEDTYYNTEDGLYYIDIDGDGKIDTGCPEPGSEYTPEDDWPKEDDPIQDPIEDNNTNWGDNTDNSDIDNNFSNNENNGENDENDEYYKNLGNEGIEKIRADLRNRNVKIQQVKMSAGEAILNASGIGLNTNGLITSCINFIKDAPPSALAFGNAISIAGFAVGASQTWIGYGDGDITTQDKLNLISTALNAAGLACALIPGGQIASGVLGATSCVIGLISTFVTSEVPREIHLEFEDGTSFHMYLIA